MVVAFYVKQTRLNWLITNGKDFKGLLYLRAYKVGPNSAIYVNRLSSYNQYLYQN